MRQKAEDSGTSAWKLALFGLYRINLRWNHVSLKWLCWNARKLRPTKKTAAQNVYQSNFTSFDLNINNTGFLWLLIEIWRAIKTFRGPAFKPRNAFFFSRTAGVIIRHLALGWRFHSGKIANLIYIGKSICYYLAIAASVQFRPKKRLDRKNGQLNAKNPPKIPKRQKIFATALFLQEKFYENFRAFIHSFIIPFHFFRLCKIILINEFHFINKN